MRYEWDEAKRLLNLKNHGIDFRDVKKVFIGPTFTFEDDRSEYLERRYITLGLLDGVPVSIAHTESDEVIRPISFRRATRHETGILFDKVADQLSQASVHEGRRNPPHPRASRGKREAHRPRGRP